jgi:hypothetical protein
MQLIKPKSISGEIMVLIEEADQKLILVSPYCDFNKWTKIQHCFDCALRKNIDIEFYVRDDSTKAIEQIRQLGIEPKLIQNLHTKLYMNEKYAIVASMNLLYSSDTNSLDIAYKTRTEEEYDELIDYYERYLKNSTRRVTAKFDQFQGDIYDYIIDKLSHEMRLGVGILFEEPNSVTLNTRNRFDLFISESRQLNISGIFTKAQFKFISSRPDLIKSKPNMKLELSQGGNGRYDLIWGTIGNNLLTKSLDNVLESEKELLADSIIDFVLYVENIKNMHQETWKS